NASIIGTALLAWKDDPEFLTAIRRIWTLVVNAANSRNEIPAKFFVFGFAGEDFIGLHAESRKRRRLHREWLCRPCLFTRNIALRHCPLFDRVDGFAGLAIKEKHQSRL